MKTLELKSLNGEPITLTIDTYGKKKKVKKYMQEEKEVVINFTSIVNRIKGSSVDRGFNFSSDIIFNEIEKLADSQNHFVGKIIEDARNGKFISDKQACVVAYFAKNNGIIK